MLVLGVLLLALTPSRVGLRVEEAQGVPPDDVAAVARAIAEEIERSTGSSATFDDALWTDCGTRDGCLAELRARLGASDLVLLRAYGAGTRVRLVAERAEGPRGIVLRRVQLDIPWAREDWPAAARAIAGALFPPARTTTATITADPLPAFAPAEAPSPVWPAYVAGGGGLVLAATAVALRLSSNAARDRVENEPLGPADVEALMDRSTAHGLASNLLFGAGAVLVTASIVYLLTDP